MNVMVATPASSEYCNSGCESGWTVYLEHSTQYDNRANFDDAYYRREMIPCEGIHGKQLYNDDNEENDEEEEEDMSMVSDASSGPPHFDVEDEVEGCHYGGRNKRASKSPRCHEVDDFTLDDTASSPLTFVSNKKNRGVHHVETNKGSSESSTDYSSQGHSANHFQERPTNLQEFYGIFQTPLATERFASNQWY